ncbi:hypothetical protein [Streptomyces sp. NPDC003393]
MRRPGSQSQFNVRSQVPHSRHDTLRHVLDQVAEKPGANHTVSSMARRAGVSIRHMTRLFTEEAGTTPAGMWSRSGWKPPGCC